MPEILKISPDNPDASLIAKAVAVLKMGGVIAFPTETFYGLGVDGQNQEAIKKIFQIKGRDFKQPISIIIGSAGDLQEIVSDPPGIAGKLMQTFWPGPLTLIFKASPSVSPLLTAGTGKIGVRISSHPIANALAEELGHPVTATSANLSGAPECSSADEVIHAIGDLVDLVIDGGPTPGISGSTILNVTTSPPLILREGVIPASSLQPLLLL
jgi:L-threonylcarbamoyladenylate synthase